VFGNPGPAPGLEGPALSNSPMVIDMSDDDKHDYRALRDWFRAAIKARGLDHRAEPMSYEANTAYDHAYYRLQAEAREVWLRHHGYAPPDEYLARAFFDAEIDRYRRARDWRNPLGWLRRLWTQRRKPRCPHARCG